MNIPSLPTDNLYKFYAIFGLILFTIGAYFEYSNLTNAIETKKQQEKADFQFFQDSLFYSKNHESYIYLMELFNKGINSPHTEKYDEIMLEEVEKKIEEYKQSILKMESSRLNLVEHNNNMKAIDLTFDFFHYLSIAMMIFGSFLLFFGFYNWQVKFQKYIDAEMKWKGMIYEEKLKKKQQEDTAKKESDTNNQEPDTETESDS